VTKGHANHQAGHVQVGLGKEKRGKQRGDVINWVLRKKIWQVVQVLGGEGKQREGRRIHTAKGGEGGKSE